MKDKYRSPITISLNDLIRRLMQGMEEIRLMDEINKETRTNLEKKYGCPIWVDREGGMHPLATMSKDHMINSYTWLIRRRHEADDHFYNHSIDGLGSIGVPGTHVHNMIVNHYVEETRVQLTKWIMTFKAWIVRRGWEVPEHAWEPASLGDDILMDSIDILVALLQGGRYADRKETGSEGVSEESAS